MQVCVFWNPVAPEWWCAQSWPRPILRATQHRCRCNSVASCCRPHKLWKSADGQNSVTMSKSVKRVVVKEAICITGASCTSIHCNFPTTRLTTWLCVCVQKSMDNFRGCRLNWILSCFVLRGAISSSLHRFGCYVLDFSLFGNFLWIGERFILKWPQLEWPSLSWGPNSPKDLAKVARNYDTPSQSMLLHDLSIIWSLENIHHTRIGTCILSAGWVSVRSDVRSKFMGENIQ
jgi:hypothetical protein